MTKNWTKLQVSIETNIVLKRAHQRMIPTLILFDLIFARWPGSAILIGTLAWPLRLLADNTISEGDLLLGAAGYASINTGVGVLVHQTVRQFLRRLRYEYAT